MRIGMMADIYKTQVSGVTNYIRLQKSWLEKQGHDVFIFTFGDASFVDTDKNVMRTRGVPLADTGIYLNYRYKKEARHLLTTMDIAHVHHPFVSGSLAMRYCLPRNIPIVFTNHTRYDLYAHAYVPIVPDKVGGAAVKAYLAPFYRACNLVIAPSPSIKQVLEQKYGVESPIEVIPHGLDLARFYEVINPRERASFGFTSQDIVAIYLGRLAPEKNMPFLIEAFHAVASNYDHVRLLIVGDGPKREALQKQVEALKLGEKVRFTGMIDYRDVPAYLAAADFFITPSISETFGLTTVEAMAAGLPVIGVEAPGTRDIIEDGVTGLVSSNDLAIFIAKFVLLSTEAELRKKMGQQARRESEKYNIQDNTDILIGHYQRLVDEARLRKFNLSKKIIRMTDDI